MNDRFMAESHGGGVVGVLVRILCVAGGAVVGAFVLALLAPGAGTAHAAGEPAETDVFWAQPDAVSSAAARRAGDEPAAVAAGVERSAPASGTAEEAGPQPLAAAQRAPVGSASMAPVGTGSAGGGSADGGPSITSLAVLCSALAAVLWLSQRLRHGEVRARSAFVTLSLERPG
jgi:hypothetical protein